MAITLKYIPVEPLVTISTTVILAKATNRAHLLYCNTLVAGLSVSLLPFHIPTVDKAGVVSCTSVCIILVEDLPIFFLLKT